MTTAEIAEAIAALESLLNAGTQSVSVDGTSVNFDMAEVRRRLRELYAMQDQAAVKRPVVATVRLDRAF